MLLNQSPCVMNTCITTVPSKDSLKFKENLTYRNNKLNYLTYWLIFLILSILKYKTASTTIASVGLT